MPDDNTTDDTARQSANDALTPQDDIFNPAADQEQLAEDNDPPAAPADTVTDPSLAPADHPEYDYTGDRDAHEIYDEGAANATDNQTETATEQAFPLEPRDDTATSDDQ